MIVFLSTEQPPINFTCDISSRFYHVINHVVCEFRLLGVASQLKPEDSKSEAWRKYAMLCLLHSNDVLRRLLRPAEDNTKDVKIKVEDLLSIKPADAHTHTSFSVLIDTIHWEVELKLTLDLL